MRTLLPVVVDVSRPQYPAGLRECTGSPQPALTGRADPAAMPPAFLEPVPDLATPQASPARGRIDVVVPVHNEQRALPWSIRRLHDHLLTHLPYDWRIVIADNASTDETPLIAAAVAADLPGVEAVELSEKGRGRALRAAWLGSDADVLVYMDVDLSTDLKALLPLVAPLLSGHSDVAIGSRLADGARVVRGPKRELISLV